MAGFEVTLYGRICSDHRGFQTDIKEENIGFVKYENSAPKPQRTLEL